MTNEILELTPEEIKEIREIFSDTDTNNYEYELVKDIFDDSIQTVKKGEW